MIELVDTPELQKQPARRALRVCAFLIDAFLALSCVSVAWKIPRFRFLVILICLLVLTEINFQLQGSIGKVICQLRLSSTNRFRFYMRELVGKAVSGLTFGIGFFMILSSERKGLHDYIGHTTVIPTVKGHPARVPIAGVLLALFSGIASFIGMKLAQPSHSLPATIIKSASDFSSAVLTIYAYDNADHPSVQGSGFIVDRHGIGITNAHVLANSIRAEAKAGDGRLFDLVSIDGFDSKRDIAIFKLGRRGKNGITGFDDLPTVNLGNSDGLHVADKVIVISSPKDFENTISDGLVSAIREDAGSKFIQITAPISPGSSGGPVFDLRAEVVGIATSQASEGQNLNFAIPIEIAESLLKNSKEQPYDLFATLEAAPSPDATKRSKASLGSRVQLYSGTVTNKTAELTANAAIALVSSGSQLEGCFGVELPLIGSGSFTGSETGNTLFFLVKRSDLSIDFFGFRSGGTLSGTYTVTQSTGATEQGTFVFTKAHRRVNALQSCPSDDDMNR